MAVKKGLLNLAYKLSFNKTTKFLDELKKTQILSSSEIKLVQWQRLRELLEFSYKKSEFYKNVFKKARLTPSDITCREDLAKLPVITKEQIRKYKSEIFSGRRELLIRSSGTTSNLPAETFMDLESAGKKFAIYLRHLFRYGWDFNVKIIHFLPLAYKDKIIDCNNGVKQCLYTLIQNKIAHNFFTNRKVIFYDNLAASINEKRLIQYLKKLNSYKNKIIIGRADFLNILACNLARLRGNLIKPKAIINMGVLLPEALKRRIESFFDCPVYNIYGSSEFSYIAGSCPMNEGLHINEETHYVEIENCKENLISKKLGKILVTDLLNYSMPLIRYDLGDIGSIEEGNCKYSGLRLLNIEGRENNCIPFNGAAFITENEICDEILSDTNIVQFHLEYSKKNEAELQIVKANPGIDETKLRERLESIGLNKIKFRYVNTLSTNCRDKLQYVSII